MMKRKKSICFPVDTYKNVVMKRYEAFMASLNKMDNEYKECLLESLYEFIVEEFETLKSNKDVEYSIERDLIFYKNNGWSKADYFMRRITAFRNS